MKKIFTIIVLLVVIVLSFGYALLKMMSVGPENNYFNRHWRAVFDRSPALRDILDLHFDGDGKTDYLGNKFSKIVMEVDVLNGETIDRQTLQEVTQKMQAVTGKPTSYFISDTDIAGSHELSDLEIGQIAAQYRNLKTGNDTASVYLIVTGQKPQAPKLLGSTYQEYGIVIYNQAVKDFTKNAPQTFDRYILSTILHEFGHQLSLPHNGNEQCLMNEHAELDSTAKADSSRVIVDFCDYEKELIKHQVQP
jgi:predicted Zn-dependent protease